MLASKTKMRAVLFAVLAAALPLAACATPEGGQTATGISTGLFVQPVNPARQRMISGLTDKDLSQIDAETLRANYGTPNFIRKEVEAELWRYDAGSCAVFFFLYRDAAVLRLRHAESAPRGRDAAVDPACLSRIVKRDVPVS